MFHMAESIPAFKKCFCELKFDDYESDYKALIKKEGTSTMEIRRMREIFKAIILTQITGTLYLFLSKL